MLDRAIAVASRVRSWLASGAAVTSQRGRHFGVVLDGGRLGQAYTEEAFLYFLEIEQKRSKRSGRPFLLVLLRHREGQDRRGSVDPVIAAKLFAALWQCLRETDFMGWYESGSVAGAVLTQLGDAGVDISEQIRRRIGHTLRESLSLDVSNQFDVQVHQFDNGLKD